MLIYGGNPFHPVTGAAHVHLLLSSMGATDSGRTEYDPVGADVGEASDYEVEEPDRDFPLRGLVHRRRSYHHPQR